MKQPHIRRIWLRRRCITLATVGAPACLEKYVNAYVIENMKQ